MPRSPVALFVTDEPDEVARGAADDAAEAIRAHRRANVLFAVGESPGGLYGELAERRKRGVLDTSRIRAVQLDEYLGVSPDGGGRALTPSRSNREPVPGAGFEPA